RKAARPSFCIFELPYLLRIMTHLQPITLTGQYVQLIPLTLDHVDALWEVGHHPSIWKWNPLPMVRREDMVAYVESALESQSKGDMLPFATVERKSGQIIGSTRFAAISLPNKRSDGRGLRLLGNERL
ncbi:MAG: GNAT family N-acetyltransferase, partial [Bacteroidetes bacterium]|nr:GNAT family N-acetyltransferase [Bacteroidota bacterium]